jgi:hypothetical protein
MDEGSEHGSGRGRRKRVANTIDSSEEEISVLHVGAEVEAEYKGKWYAATLAGEGQGETDGKYRWCVRCACDREGTLTYTNRVRKRRAWSRAIVRLEEEQPTTGRRRRIRKVRGVTRATEEPTTDDEGAPAEEGRTGMAAARAEGREPRQERNAEAAERQEEEETRAAAERRASRALRQRCEQRGGTMVMSEEEQRDNMEESREDGEDGREGEQERRVGVRRRKRSRAIESEDEGEGRASRAVQQGGRSSEARRRMASEERDYETLVKDTG